MDGSWPASGSRNLGTFVGTICPKTGPVKRWDGAARSSRPWDQLRKDSELWLRNGNCQVHLYAKGQSKRGPSFKVPFRELLSKKCFPLIERFLVTDGPAPRTPGQLAQWGSDPRRIVDLYIPPPPNANRDQAYVYHIATRNFFAWVFRRSMVGEHLGQAIVGLLHSMHEFRSDVKDNVQDMLDYLDEEGYLDLVDEPDHALAMLYVAESFQMRELYIRAFAHCVGMDELLQETTEYEPLSLDTKSQLRAARTEMVSRLDTANRMLHDFLDEELSESHLGLKAGARAHLERFRSFLWSFYSARLGYYPPQKFAPSLYRSMRDEFEALYRLLVDDDYLITSTLPTVASGGICTLQTVQTFDSKHKYAALSHPLPLLPDTPKVASRFPWRTRIERLRPDQKLLANAALIKASNWKEKVFHNDLVKAYREFEQESVMNPSKADKNEKVSLADGRKIRWILIYALYQVLRSVTEIPDEVFDSDEATYNVAISMKDLPPWDTSMDIKDLLRRQTDLAVPETPSIYWSDSAGISNNSSKIEIRPDIDYFARTQKPTIPQRSSSVLVTSRMEKIKASDSAIRPARSKSATRALSRNGTIRRSMRMFKPSSAVPPPLNIPQKPVYQEIVVQGYGNGLDNDDTEPKEDSSFPPTRNHSTASNSGSEHDSSLLSMGSSETAESSLVTPTSSTTPVSRFTSPLDGRPPRSEKRDVMSMILNTSRSTPSIRPKRPMSTIVPSSRDTSSILSGDDYSNIYTELVEEQRQSFFGGDYSPITTKRTSHKPRLFIEDDWSAMQAFMEEDEEAEEMQGSRRDSCWEQYTDLGGLTDMR